MDTSSKIKNRQNMLYNSIVSYNELQTFNNLLALISNLKSFSDYIVQAKKILISKEDYAKIKSISEGNFNCCSIDTILELSSQCCEMI